MILGKFHPRRDENFEQIYEREKMLEIIAHRIQQLQEILDKSETLTHDARIRLEIEVKFLSLKDLFFNSR